METLNQLSKLFVLDLRNIIGLLFWGNLALATLVFTFRHTNFSKDNKTHLLVFGFSKIFQAFAWLVFFLRVDTAVFNPINVIVPNTLVFTSYYLESIAMLMILKDKSKKAYRIQSIIFVVVLLSFYYSVYAQIANNIRIVIASLSIFLMLILPSLRFLTATQSSLFKKILGANYIILLIGLIFRIIYSLFNTTTALYTADLSQRIVFLIIFLMMIISGVGYLLLLQEEKEIQIKKLLNDKNTFFSIIAHDLKGPFNGIIGLSELLVEKKLNDDEANEFIQLIHQSSKDTYSLLENLLTWSQSQTGNINFSPTELEITLITNKTINLLSNIAKKKNITIQSNIKNNQYVFADKNMLETIFRNLISNAIKFTQPNGEVILSMTKVNKQTIFSIQDNGIGINPEKVAQLFAINNRYTTPGTDSETGTGLGLMLCKEFIEKHDGKIWVESKMGKGSNFKFSIPNHL